MTLTPYLGAALVMTAVVLLVLALAHSDAPHAMVRSNLAVPPPHDLRALQLAQPARERMVRPVVRHAADAARRLSPRSAVSTLERRAQLAGLSDRWPAERLLAAKTAAGLLGACIGILWIATAGSAAAVLLAVATTVGGFLLPDLLLGLKARERQERIERDLPDVLDQVTICVEAGLGFEAALLRAAGAGRGPISVELSRTLQDIGLGMPRRAALEQLIARTDVADLRHFVVAISQAERHGVPIAQVLRTQSAELRDKRRQLAEERAMKVPVKLVFPLVLCILPALFVVLMGPAAIRIAESSFGG